MKETGFERKHKMTFFKAFWLSSFKIFYFWNNFLHAMAVFGLFTKVIKRSGTSFCYTFSALFFYKNVFLSDTPSMDKVSMSYLFSFLGYQTKCVIEFLVRQLMTSWTLRFIFDHPPRQWSTGRKRGEDRNTKNWISR